MTDPNLITLVEEISRNIDGLVVVIPLALGIIVGELIILVFRK